MRNKIVAILAVMVLCGCQGRQHKDSPDFMMVSILPLKYLVDNIVGPDIEVRVLVPPGSNPESYEPTPNQIRSAESAKLLFSTGLVDFERILMNRLSDKERFVDLSKGIELIEGTCSAHSHSGHGHSHSHSHGTDPHIWTSPKALMSMAETAYSAIHSVYPDSVRYTANFTLLMRNLEELDRTAQSRIESSGRSSFMIFHPGLTYYARDYGLQQIALEQDGKEPSARQLQQIIELSRNEGISKVFYQNEFPRTVVEIAAKEIGARPVEINILGYDVIQNILEITDQIISE